MRPIWSWSLVMLVEMMLKMRLECWEGSSRDEVERLVRSAAVVSACVWRV